MHVEGILKVVWQVMNSPAVIAALAALVLYALNRLYVREPLWQRYEGVIVKAIRFAERQIPDSTPNRALARLDAALKYVLAVFEEVEQRRARGYEVRELREGIQIQHARLEQTGRLGPPSKAGDRGSNRDISRLETSTNRDVSRLGTPGKKG